MAFNDILSSKIPATRQLCSVTHSSIDLALVRGELTIEERKKIPKRSCTLCQRQRYYTHEIILRNIDR